MIEAPKHDAEEFMQALEKQVIKSLPPLPVDNYDDRMIMNPQPIPELKPIVTSIPEEDDDEIKPRKKSYEEMLRFIGIK